MLYIIGLPQWLNSKESACNAGDSGDKGLSPGLGRSPGGGNGNPPQYSWLRNPMDRGAWRAGVHSSQSWTRLERLRQHTCSYHLGRAALWLHLLGLEVTRVGTDNLVISASVRKAKSEKYELSHFRA